VEPDPGQLKPWQRYQIVRAAWPPIVDSKTFSEVQQILEENLAIERRRLSKSEARVFLLSGILSCGECGRPLNGQSAHGEHGVHRYYYHAYKRGEKIECSQKRIRADEVEQVVVNHLVEVAGRAGYFEQIQEKLAASMKNGPQQVEEQLMQAKILLEEVEKEIVSTFKIQMNALGGTEASSLAAEHLEKLGKRKKVLKKHINDLETLRVSLNDRGSQGIC
jgi:site-specific DNA recombinase